MFVDIIKSILPSLSDSDTKKSHIMTLLDNMETTLSNSIIPMLYSLEDVKHENVAKNDIIERFAKSFNLKNKKSKDVFAEFKDFFSKLSELLPKFKEDVNKYLPSIISKRTLTCRDAAYLKTIYDLNGMITYFPDFLYYVLNNGKPNTLPKKMFTDINDNIPTFGELYVSYSRNLKDTLSKLKDVSDEEYNGTDDDFLEQLYTNKSPKLSLPLSSGFVYNPFYHFFMWIEDYLYKRYEANKETKRLIELKIQELKFKEQSASGPELDKLNKQIEYYEGVVADLNYKISKYRDKYNNIQ